MNLKIPGTRDKNKVYRSRSPGRSIKRLRHNPISSSYDISIARLARRSAYFIKPFSRKRNSSLSDLKFLFPLSGCYLNYEWRKHKRTYVRACLYLFALLSALFCGFFLIEAKSGWHKFNSRNEKSFILNGL